MTETFKERWEKIADAEGIINDVAKTAFRTSAEVTDEQVYEEMINIHNWMAVPKNKILSRIAGHLFLCHDTINCMENGWEIKQIME